MVEIQFGNKIVKALKADILKSSLVNIEAEICVAIEAPIGLTQLWI